MWKHKHEISHISIYTYIHTYLMYFTASKALIYLISYLLHSLVVCRAETSIILLQMRKSRVKTLISLSEVSRLLNCIGKIQANIFLFQENNYFHYHSDYYLYNQ